VKRGDVLKDILSGIQVIGIVDGEFLQNHAVSPSEIIDALRCGLRVYGSSSMGALRAVELDKYGMIGYGRIYETIKKEPYFKDDHLGQIFFEGESMDVSPSMMDVKMAILDLVDAGSLTPRHGKWFIDSYEELHFSERNFSMLKSKMSGPPSRPKIRADVIDKIVAKISRTKKSDALGLLSKIKADLKEIQRLNRDLNNHF
jgi:hypothetical protein